MNLGNTWIPACAGMTTQRATLQKIKTIPRESKPIIEVVMESGTYDYPTLLEAPAPTQVHPAYEEDRRSRGIDRSALVRKHTPEALRQFKQALQEKESDIPSKPGEWKIKLPSNVLSPLWVALNSLKLSI